MGKLNSKEGKWVSASSWSCKGRQTPSSSTGKEEKFSGMTQLGWPRGKRTQRGGGNQLVGPYEATKSQKKVVGKGLGGGEGKDDQPGGKTYR